MAHKGLNEKPHLPRASIQKHPPSTFFAFTILSICMRKAKASYQLPLTWATEANLAQIIHLIPQPVRGPLPIVCVLAKHNGLTQSQGRDMNTVFRRKAIQQKYELRGWIYKGETSNEVIGNSCESWGAGLGCPWPRLSALISDCFCALPKATPPPSSP